MGEPDDDEPDVHITSAEEMKKMNLIAEETDADTANQSTDIEQADTFSPRQLEPFKQQAYPQKSVTLNRGPRKTKLNIVPVEAIDFAIEQIKKYIEFRENEDIDKIDEPRREEENEKWTKFNEWFYAACQ